MRKTDRQSAREIKLSFKPVGYSTPSPEVMILDSSACASAADIVFFNSDPSFFWDGAGDGDLVASLDFSPATVVAFSVTLGEDVE